MVRVKRPLLTKVIERIPQTLCLSSGINIQLRHKRDNRKFWDIFTSSEYMSLIPELATLKAQSISILDCGAGIGLFSLLIEHLCRIGVLPWDNVLYTLIEPSSHNFIKLEQNIKRNLANESCRLINGLLGLKNGDAEFYESKKKPYGSRLAGKTNGEDGVVKRLPFIDISAFLQAKPCFVKMDIEGSEFIFLETYRKELTNVEGIMIEWHSEMGDVEEGEFILSASGLRRVKRSPDKDNDNRFTDLYLKTL